VKIIRSIKDITNKIEEGVPYDAYKSAYNSAFSAIVRHPFETLKLKDRLLMSLLSVLRNNKKITFEEYYVSKIFFYVYWIAVSARDFFSSRFRHWEFSCQQNNVLDGRDYITCSKGIQRARSYYLMGEDVYDVPLIKKYSNLNISDRLKVLKLMFGMKCYSYWHAAQFYVLDKTKPRAKNLKVIVMEEGVDYAGRCFLYLLKNENTKTVLTYATASTSGLRESVGFDRVITNNFLGKENFNRSDVELLPFPPNVDIRSFKRAKTRCIGYAPDIGSPILSSKKKIAMDESFFCVSKMQRYNVKVTVHPQDNRGRYDKFLVSNLIDYRCEPTVEEFLSSIDILVTWWSSLIFQAVYCGVPVIIFDRYSAGHVDALMKYSNGFVRIAASGDDLQASIEFFRSLPGELLTAMHMKCRRSLFYGVMDQ